MKEKMFLALFMAASVTITSCGDNKTDKTTDEKKADTTATVAAAEYKAVPQDALKAFVDGLNSIKSLGKAEVESFSTKDNGITEARIRVTKADGSMLTFAVTDLGVDTAIYRGYLSGKLIAQGTDGLVFKGSTDDIKNLQGIKLDQSTGYGAIDFYNAATDAALSKQSTESNITLAQVTEAMQSTDVTRGGDFIAPLKAETPDLAGWVIYDAKSKMGVVNAGYADRFAIVVSGNNLNSISELNKVISSVDFSPLKGLKDKFNQGT